VGEAVTTAELIDLHLRQLEIQGRRSLASIGQYLKEYRRWLEAESLELGDVDARHAEAYQTDLATRMNDAGEARYRAKTVSVMLWSVRSFYEWLREGGYVERNPFRQIPRMKVGKRIPREVPTADELCENLDSLARFWETAPGVPATTSEKRTRYRVHVISELLYATGMRIGELGALRVEDIDVADRLVRIRDGKGALSRSAYMNDYAASVVGIYVERMRKSVHYRFFQETLFGTKDGQCLGGQLNVQLKKYVGMTSHGFRHAVGTHLLSSGCDLRMIQLILGHEDLKSTAIYTKVVKEELREQLDRHHPRGGHEQCVSHSSGVPGEPAGAGLEREDTENDEDRAR
jgi:site-specific recombinase XerD